MEATFICGVAIGVVATLITIRIARKAKPPFEAWLAGKLQALMAKRTN